MAYWPWWNTMPPTDVYNTLEWELARSRAISRDRGLCTVARILGGDCSLDPLHVHHVRPVSEGGAPYDLTNLATVCASHHPIWEGLRRSLVAASTPKQKTPPRCRHFHRTDAARRECELRMTAAARRSRIAA
jgi:hypothetical protein